MHQTKGSMHSHGLLGLGVKLRKALVTLDGFHIP